eukprot:CAMPEP_0175845382 /NCGR_PEP_ID=MMETSP0107_2-20121207/22186_1 /TAXON_ID=195067 ORGANISM="Goniomonas pacifica, Strain CCMP1869" /NCGR_SAMPLE_ID=MMETSP0107_2 /ASSEMBLY_ACC=CAM_ASM_000203 /LENGTH=116 /DNA_ID=CAMNT_0017159919 /DNA_START=28 /DNA_END=378 /DNA_ORIENTATION=-
MTACPTPRVRFNRCCSPQEPPSTSAFGTSHGAVQWCWCRAVWCCWCRAVGVAPCRAVWAVHVLCSRLIRCDRRGVDFVRVVATRGPVIEGARLITTVDAAVTSGAIPTSAALIGSS